MAQAISNISDVSSSENVKSLSLTEELARVNKVKYNLGIVYFLAVTGVIIALFL